MKKIGNIAQMGYFIASTTITAELLKLNRNLKVPLFEQWNYREYLLLQWLEITILTEKWTK